MLTLKTAHLKAALTHASKDDIRYYLNGVLIERTATGDIHLVSTDGHRMFCGLICAPNVVCDQVGPWQIIVPSSALKIACAGKAPVVLLDALPDGSYTLGGAHFMPCDGKFPDWRRVKPDTTRPVVADGQFNWEYLAEANKALRLWYGSAKSNYWLKTLADTKLGYAAIGCMLGSDCTACVIVMPLRDDSITCATPFNPSAYM